MDASQIRTTDVANRPAPLAAEPPTPNDVAPAAMVGDRFMSTRSGSPQAFDRLSPWRKLTLGVGLAVQQVPGTLKALGENKQETLAGLVAPYLHPVRSWHEANQAVSEAAKQGPVEAALGGLKHHGGLLSAWALPVSIALAPMTGGASLAAPVVLALGAVSVGALGGSLLKNAADIATADSEDALRQQSQELLADGLGLGLAAASAGAGKVAARAVAAAVKPAATLEAVIHAAPELPVAPKAPRHKAPNAVAPPAQVVPDLAAPKPMAELPQAVAGPSALEAELPPAMIEPKIAQAPPAEPQVIEKRVAQAPSPDVAPGDAIQRRPISDHPVALQEALDDHELFLGQLGRRNYMPELLKEAGFDGPATVVTEAALTLAVQRGERELFRGVSDKAFAEQFRHGELYVGTQNANGSGTFVAYGADGAKTAARYGSGRGAVLRMTLKPDAKVVTYAELTKLLKAEKAEAVAASVAKRQAAMAEAAKAATPELRKQLEGEANVANSARSTAIGFRFSDLGRYAVLKGYDAVDMESTQFMNVVNRTALRVQDVDVTAPLAVPRRAAT